MKVTEFSSGMPTLTLLNILEEPPAIVVMLLLLLLLSYIIQLNLQPLIYEPLTVMLSCRHSPRIKVTLRVSNSL